MGAGGGLHSSIRFARMSVWISSPLPMIPRSPPGCFLSSATASATSPSSSVEFDHGSGSRNVRDATYFWVVLSAFVNGLSGCVFQ
jgi:hypothetical protein